MQKLPALPKLFGATIVAFITSGCAKGTSIDDGFGGTSISSGARTAVSGSGTTGTQSTPTAQAAQSSTTQAADASSTTVVASSTQSVSSTGTGGVCAEAPCKLVTPQCGCAGMEQCSLNDTGMRHCIPAGTVSIGGACSDVAGCAPGGLCAGSPNVNRCLQFCNDDGDCISGGRCVIELVDGNDQPIPNVTLCSEICDPILATGCPVPGTGCQPAEGYTICVDSGAGGDLDPCTRNADCAPGFGCIDNGTGVVCLKWCNLNADACPFGTFCNGLNPPLVVGGTTYGICD